MPWVPDVGGVGREGGGAGGGEDDAANPEPGGAIAVRRAGLAAALCRRVAGAQTGGAAGALLVRELHYREQGECLWGEKQLIKASRCVSPVPKPECACLKHLITINVQY